MRREEPVLRKIRSGYKIVFGSYTTEVLFKRHEFNSEPLNVKTFLGRKSVAWLNGTTIGNAAKIYKLEPVETISRAEGLRALSVLVPCTEIALSQVSIKTIGGRTHKNFARFLTQLGWKIVEAGKNCVDVEKQILKKPKFLFRPRPVVKKRKKKAIAKKPKRRL